MAAYPTINLKGDDAILQGSDYARSFQFLDEFGSPVPLVGKSVRAQLRADYADLQSTIIATLNCTVINDVAGVILIQLTNAVTQGIAVTLNGKVDWEAFDAATVSRIGAGEWECLREVTR